jgi:hypothetical protein
MQPGHPEELRVVRPGANKPTRSRLTRRTSHERHTTPHDPDTDLPFISEYSRAQAIADGVLVDVTQDARKAGFRYPVAMTRAVWDLCVALSPAAKKACNDEAGRLWDVLWMMSCAVRRAHDAEQVFALRCVTTSLRPSNIALRSVIGPGDDGEPVITVMLPDES